MANDVDQRTKLKLCTDCGGYYLLAFFRLSRYPYRPPGMKPGLQHYRDRCIGCDAIRNVEETMDQRLRRKALGTRRRHGAKLKQLGMIKKESDLEEIYDWSLEQMIVDIVHVRDKGCPYCHQPVDIIEQGLGAITLDIFNAELPPHYSTNVVWCCAGCNSEKQRTSPEVWGARQSMWRLWRRNQVQRGVDPEEFGFLALKDDEDESPVLPFGE